LTTFRDVHDPEMVAFLYLVDVEDVFEDGIDGFRFWWAAWRMHSERAVAEVYRAFFIRLACF
jgi:hypothetical protein